MKRELTRLTVKEMAQGLKKREFSCFELTGAHLDAIAKKDEEIGAYLTVCAEKAKERALALDALGKEQRISTPLYGVPYALKDNICTAGIRTTCASKMLEDFAPPYDATVEERLKAAGGVLLGKTNMDEFGMGSTTEYSALQKTLNPIAPDFVPGGSSGGSAAAVAAYEAPYALGSDTGGSVRLPAAYCGLVGLKPSYGALSRYGLVAFASSLEQVGVLSRGVYENAAAFLTLLGADEKDATSRAFPPFDLERTEQAGVKGLRIALLRPFFEKGVDPRVAQGVLDAAKTLEHMGAQVTFCPLTPPEHSLAAYYVISSAEASSNLARFDGVRFGKRCEKGDSLEESYAFSRGEGFGKEVKKRVLFGGYVLSAGQIDRYYHKARAVAAALKGEVTSLFEDFDLLLCPTAPALPPKRGEHPPTNAYGQDLCTVLANLTGLPALCLPCERTREGLPLSLQILAPMGREDLLYRAAFAYEGEEKK